MKPTSKYLVSLLVVLTLLLSGCGITAPRSNDGFADLDSLGFEDTDMTLSLSFGPILLHLAASFIEDDPATRTLLRNLDGVRVRSYDIVGDGEGVAQRLDAMGSKLRNQGWEPVITVQEAGERALVLVKMDGSHITGLTVMALDAHEAVLVNVMGNLPPELFTETIAALDVDAPQVQVAATQ